MFITIGYEILPYITFISNLILKTCIVLKWKIKTTLIFKKVELKKSFTF